MSALRNLVTHLWSHRRRVAPLVLILGLGAIGGEILGAWPHATEIRFDFGPDHQTVRAARIAYVLDGDEAAGARFEWSVGAPEALRHVVDLEPGRYAVVADLDSVEREHARIERALVVPADGVVRIALFEDSARVTHARRSE